MFHFTKQEKQILLSLGLILLIGTSLHYAFKKYPNLHDIVNLIDSDKVHQKIDLNSATKEELIAIPYIGEYTADKIIEYRRENGKFTHIEQLKSIKGIREKNFKRFKKHIIVK